MIVPVPEETWVARKQGRSLVKWATGVGLIAALIASASLYYLYSVDNSRRREQTSRPVASPTPYPSPTLIENNNVNTEPDAGPDQLAARAKLARANIPYTEEAFTRVVKNGDTGAVDLFLAAGMSPDAQDTTGRTALITAASRGSDHISRNTVEQGANVNALDNNGSTP